MNISFLFILSLRFHSSFDQVHQACVCITVRPELQKEDSGGNQTQSTRRRGLAAGKLTEGAQQQH